MKKITLLITLFFTINSFSQIKTLKGKNDVATACVAGSFNAIMYPNGWGGDTSKAYAGESSTANWEFTADLAGNTNSMGNANVFYIAEIVFDNNIPVDTDVADILSIASADFNLTSFAHNAINTTLAGCGFGGTQLNKIRFNLEYVGPAFTTSFVTLDITVTDVATASVETITLTIQPEGSLSTKDLSHFNFNYAPNPTKDILNLSANKNISKIELYNILGQKAISKETNSLRPQINISSLQKGIYLMNVTIDDAVGIYKIIKN